MRTTNRRIFPRPLRTTSRPKGYHRLSGARGRYVYGVGLPDMPTTGEAAPHMRYPTIITGKRVPFKDHVTGLLYFHELCHVLQDLFTPFGAYHYLRRKYLNVACLETISAQRGLFIYPPPPKHPLPKTGARRNSIVAAMLLRHELSRFEEETWCVFPEDGSSFQETLSLFRLLEGEAALRTHLTGAFRLLEWGRGLPPSEQLEFAKVYRLDLQPTVYMSLAAVADWTLGFKHNEILLPDTQLPPYSSHSLGNLPMMLVRFALDFALAQVSPDDGDMPDFPTPPLTFLSALDAMRTMTDEDFKQVFKGLLTSFEDAEERLHRAIARQEDDPLHGRRLHTIRYSATAWAEMLDSEVGDPMAIVRARALRYRTREPESYYTLDPGTIFFKADIPMPLYTRDKLHPQDDLPILAAHEVPEGLAERMMDFAMETSVVDTLAGGLSFLCPRYPRCKCHAQVTKVRCVLDEFPSPECLARLKLQQYNIDLARLQRRRRGVDMI